MKKPTLFATLGFPGSGKTYFSERFAKEFKLFHLNSDRLRLDMIENPKYTSQEHRQVFTVMDYITDHLLAAGISVIYDANSTKRAYRNRLRKIARINKANYLLIHIKTPVATAEKRLEKRKLIKSSAKQKYYRPIEKEVLHGIRKETEEPLPTEPHVVIDGLKRYKDQITLVKSVLK